MAHIEKRGKKYRVCWRDRQRERRSRTCPDRRTAEKVRREVEQALAEGRRWDPDPVREEPSIEELMKAYLQDCARARKASSIRRYAGNLDITLEWFRKRSGQRDGGSPAVLSKQVLADLYDDLRAQGLKGRRQPATVKKIVEVFERMWRWAANEDGYTEFVPPPKRLEMSDGPANPVVAPTWAEMDACIAAARGWVRMLAIVLRCTGLRVQQVMMLRWDDVDLSQGLLTIRGELGKSPHESRGRIIPISKHLVAEMTSWEREQEFIIPCGRKQDGPRAREARGRDMTRAWRRAGVREEIWKQRPSHSFRKGFKTELTRDGARWEAVEHLLGHQVGDSVTARYLDPEFLPLKETVDRVPPVNQHLRMVTGEEEMG